MNICYRHNRHSFVLNLMNEHRVYFIHYSLTAYTGPLGTVFLRSLDSPTQRRTLSQMFKCITGDGLREVKKNARTLPEAANFLNGLYAQITVDNTTKRLLCE